MPVFDKVLSRFGLARKQSPPVTTSRPTISVYPGMSLPAAQWTPWLYIEQARQGYQLNADVYACISLIATAGKQVKWWDGSGASKALRPMDMLMQAVGVDSAPHYAPKALSPAASIALLKESGGATFIENWLSYILLAGNSYIEIERLATGKPQHLFLDRPDRVTYPPGTRPVRGKPERWEVRTAYGTIYQVPASDMVQSKLFNPLDDVYGMAPLTAAMLRVDMQNEGAALMKRLLQQGWVPGWIEAAKDSQWGDEQVAQLKERFRDSRASRDVPFIENAQYHPIGFAPVDSGVSEMAVLAKRDIASVYHVPPQLIGDTASQTYSNYQEARRALYMEAVIPLLVEFRDDWNRTIGRELNSPLDFDKDTFDAISQARQEATDRVVKLFTSGLITQSEGRRDLEYDPVEGGDRFYAPANFLPLAAGGEEAEPEAPPKLEVIPGGKP